MQHDFQRNVEPAIQEPGAAHTPSPGSDDAANTGVRSSWLVQWRRQFVGWLQTNTFSSDFLPGPWSHPAFGYLLAVLGQIVAVTLIMLLLQAFPHFRFSSSLAFLVVLLVALGWGVGPSVAATLVGAALLMFLILPLHLSLAMARTEDVIGVALFLVIGLVVSILASQTQRARHRAETLSSSLESIIEAIPDPLVIYDRQGKPTRLNRGARAVVPESQQALALAEIVQQLDLHTLSGEKLPFEELPLARALQGEIIVGMEVSYQTVAGQERVVSISTAPLRDPKRGSIAGAVTITHDLSALRKAEREATERARQLEAIFTSITDSVNVYDREGRLVKMNAAARNFIAQVVPSEATARPIQERLAQMQLFQEDGTPVPAEQAPIPRILRGEVLTSERIEDTMVRTLAGRDLWVSVTGAPIRDADGQITGGVAFMRDVTVRRHLEQLLRETERAAIEQATLLETIVEAIPDLLLVYDRKGQLIRTNEAARCFDSLMTQPDHLALGAQKRFSKYLIRDEQGQPLPEEQMPIFRILKGEVLSSTSAEDVRVSYPDGRDVQWSVTGAPIYDDTGELVGGVMICRNVTERRELEQHTRMVLEALLQMAQVLVQGPQGAGEADEQTIPPASAVAGQMAELTRRVLGCKRLGILMVEPQTERLRPLAVVGLPPDQEQQWWAKREQQESYLANGLDPSLAPRLRAGETVLLDLSQLPWRDLPNPYGVRTGLIVPMRVGEQLVGLLILDYVGVDHTYTADELALAAAVTRLVALVIERERLLHEREEAQAITLALQVAKERMDTFIGIASHELKTPLTSLKGNLQMSRRHLNNVLQGATNGNALAQGKLELLPILLERAERQINVLTRLVSDLVEVSRIQVDKLELHLVPCDLATIVREAVADYRDTVLNRTIRLDMAEGAVVPIEADADRIGQVVSNYLSNALKYSPASSPVEVRLETQGAMARVSVRDEGPGLSPTDQEHIWERFYRVEGVQVQSGSGVGLGLGLHICQTIIEQHYGTAGVESAPEKGSTFWFALPISGQLKHP